MGCMKCGRDLETDSQVFCERCLEAMARVPVKPGTVILLPKRREEPRRIPVRRRPVVTPDMKIKKWRKRCRVLAIALAVMIVVSIFLGLYFWHLLNQEEKLLPGQNYSTMESTDGT